MRPSHKERLQSCARHTEKASPVAAQEIIRMNFLLDVFCVNNGTQKIQPNTAKGKDEEDEFDDPDDRSSTGERVTPSNAGTNAFNELLHANTSFHEIVAGWLGDDETRKNFNEMESDEERRKREADEIEEETKRMEDRAKAKKRKEEYEKHAENMRKEETMKSESERINGKGSFSYINSTSSSPSSKNPYLVCNMTRLFSLLVLSMVSLKRPLYVG